MKNSICASVVLMGCFLLNGCCTVPPAALSQASDNSLISDGFVSLMEQEKTTRTQEQAFILANRRAWHSQNFALNEVPLPEDLEPGSEGVNLLQILQADPRVRAKLNEVEGALQPDGSGN